MSNVIDIADAARAPWELDDADLENFDDPFEELTAEEEAAREEFYQREQNLYNRLGVESRRDMRESLRDQHGSLDAMEIAHERNDSAESFDYTARTYLGMRQNWDSEDSRAAREKRKADKARAGAKFSQLERTAKRASNPVSENAENYSVGIEAECVSTSPAPPEIVTQNTPDELLATTLAAFLTTAAKGLSYTRREALIELARAKVNQRSAVLWVRNLPPRTLADLNLRIDIALGQARAHVAQIEALQAARAARLEEFEAAYLPARAALWDMTREAERAYPGAFEICKYYQAYFYDAARESALRDLSFDLQAAAREYLNSQTVALRNELKSLVVSC